MDEQIIEKRKPTKQERDAAKISFANNYKTGGKYSREVLEKKGEGGVK